MPSPVTSDSLRNLIPSLGTRLCDRFKSGIVGFMTEVTNHFQYMYRADGTFSAQFAADLCALPCIGNSSGDGDEPCPTIPLSGTSSVSDGAAHLRFSGSGMIAGYTWNLFRRLLDSDPWGSAVATGTTTGSVITYDDTGLTNDTAYQYKMTVQLSGCPEYTAELTGVTPRECQALSLSLTGGASEIPGEVSFVLFERAGKLADTFLITVYMSTDPTQIGSPLLAETTVAASGFKCTTGDSVPSLCMKWALAPGSTYYFTFHLKEKSSCDQFEMKASARPASPQPNSVSISYSVAGNAGHLSIRVHPISGAPVRDILLYRKSMVTEEDLGFVPFKLVSPPQPQSDSVYIIDVPVTKADFPCNQSVSQSQCRALYQVYAVATSRDGIQSNNSNTTIVSTLFFK